MVFFFCKRNNETSKHLHVSAAIKEREAERAAYEITKHTFIFIILTKLCKNCKNSPSIKIFTVFNFEFFIFICIDIFLFIDFTVSSKYRDVEILQKVFKKLMIRFVKIPQRHIIAYK